MKQEEKKNIMCLSIGTALGITIVFGIFLTISGFMHAVTGCEGIGSYNKTGWFWMDALDIIRMANYTEGSGYKTPGQLMAGSPVDCEAVSNAVMCLSDSYPEIECSFYTTITNDPSDRGFYGHIGIKCRGMNETKWRMVY